MIRFKLVILFFESVKLLEMALVTQSGLASSLHIVEPGVILKDFEIAIVEKLIEFVDSAADISKVAVHACCDIRIILELDAAPGHLVYSNAY